MVYQVSYDFGNGRKSESQTHTFEYIKENARQIIYYNSDNAHALGAIEKLQVGGEARFWHGQHHENSYIVDEYVFIKRIE